MTGPWMWVRSVNERDDGSGDYDYGVPYLARRWTCRGLPGWGDAHGNWYAGPWVEVCAPQPEAERAAAVTELKA